MGKKNKRDIFIGKQEYVLLEQIKAGDILYGFLTSAGSSYQMNKQIHRQAKRRLASAKKRQIKQRLARLEKKNLIKPTGCKNSPFWKLTTTGKEALNREEVVSSFKSIQKSWDGRWRIVMFDIPQEYAKHRYMLRNLLIDCGAQQIQQSVYVFPYDITPLRDFLERNHTLGSYIHIFEGDYKGDSRPLRKQFGDYCRNNKKPKT